MNNYFLLDDGGNDGRKGKRKLQTFNEGAHGADVCSMMKHLNLLLKDLCTTGASYPDLFALESAVNRVRITRSTWIGRQTFISMDFKIWCSAQMRSCTNC